jgi:hypothetical protein
MRSYAAELAGEVDEIIAAVHSVAIGTSRRDG